MSFHMLSLNVALHFHVKISFYSKIILLFKHCLSLDIIEIIKNILKNADISRKTTPYHINLNNDRRRNYLLCP